MLGFAAVTTADKPAADEGKSFAETALKMGGKSDDEARRTGAIDKADDQVESLFAPQYQTTASPAHRAVWDEAGVPIDLFAFEPEPTPPHVQKVMDDSLAVVRKFKQSGTLLNAEGKVTDEVLAALGTAGYWGLLVDREFGGSGAPFSVFAPFLSRMAMLDPTIAGMASVHGCIGAVDPVRTFGNAEQKRRYLPPLASGAKLSGFALTEPWAGSDLTALRTRAVREGNEFVVNGEKLFITNVVPGRTLGLVCLIENKPAVLVVDLPTEENEHFQLKKYGLYALKHTYNRGIIFRNFRVPVANLLTPPRGDGLTIAYHGLNLGRTALCATAAGSMRNMLAEMLPWAKFRRTYGEEIVERELVQRRIGRLAGLIVAADALTAWCSSLIDHGYRGEMECIIAKIFGSEMQKEAAIELLMKTHGGRSFLQGHLFGDNVHEYLAPCIYEGEGEMLGMAFFKSLVKQHGTEYFEPIGKTLVAAKIKKPDLKNPAHLWTLRKPMLHYGKWMLGRKLHSRKASLPPMPEALRRHAEFAIAFLNGSALEISGVMRKHQLALADRQCRMSETSARVQTAIVMLCTSLYAARHTDDMVRSAADCVCQDFARSLTGKRVEDRYFRVVTKLGEQVAAGGFSPLEGTQAGEILMGYKNE
ncbi:MAG: acyl-CoA/acyl-ACP dehydrogenase [Planctomycetia bacterium]|nr:acyl-CoA/acyl-ACP dehydrogenase [Planctomycetia bacterium]